MTYVVRFTLLSALFNIKIHLWYFQVCVVECLIVYVCFCYYYYYYYVLLLFESRSFTFLYNYNQSKISLLSKWQEINTIGVTSLRIYEENIETFQWALIQNIPMFLLT
jgi:hypothetical protein